jgi:hypothetical protein
MGIARSSNGEATRTRSATSNEQRATSNERDTADHFIVVLVTHKSPTRRETSPHGSASSRAIPSTPACHVVAVTVCRGADSLRGNSGPRPRARLRTANGDDNAPVERVGRTRPTEMGDPARGDPSRRDRRDHAVHRTVLPSAASALVARVLQSGRLRSQTPRGGMIVPTLSTALDQVQSSFFLSFFLSSFFFLSSVAPLLRVDPVSPYPPYPSPYPPYPPYPPVRC